MKKIQALIIPVWILILTPLSAFCSNLESNTAFQTSSPLEKIISVLNPFWHTPTEDEDENFSINMQIPIENEWETAIIPTGYIEIFDQYNRKLEWIWTIWSTSNSSGKLVDSIEINHDRQSIPPRSSKTFDIHWLGTGDQYIEDGRPIIKLSNPIKNIPEKTLPDIHFWEKIIGIPSTYPYRAKAQLIYKNEWWETLESQKNLEMSLDIPYIRPVKTINTGFLIIMSILIGILVWLIFPKKSPKKEAPKAKSEDIPKKHHQTKKWEDQSSEKNI